MFGEPVTSCHIRMPVSSNPKYCSVSRFSKTDSRSKMRTRTWVGVAARSANETIGTAPRGNPGSQFHRARQACPSQSILPGIAALRYMPESGRSFLSLARPRAEFRLSSNGSETGLRLVPAPHKDYRHPDTSWIRKNRPRLAEPARKSRLDLD